MLDRINTMASTPKFSNLSFRGWRPNFPVSRRPRKGSGLGSGFRGHGSWVNGHGPEEEAWGNVSLHQPWRHARFLAICHPLRPNFRVSLRLTATLLRDHENLEYYTLASFRSAPWRQACSLASHVLIGVTRAHWRSWVFDHIFRS